MSLNNDPKRSVAVQLGNLSNTTDWRLSSVQYDTSEAVEFNRALKMRGYVYARSVINGLRYG